MVTVEEPPVDQRPPPVDQEQPPADQEQRSFTLTEQQIRTIVGRAVREPFTRRTWAELGYFVVSGALAFVGLAFVGATMVVGAILAITVVGLAVLALSVRSARGFGSWQRGLARSMLGESIFDPEPFEHRPGFFGWLGAALRDRVGWRSIGYVLVKVAWTFLGVYVAFSLWWDAFTCLLQIVHLAWCRQSAHLRTGPRPVPRLVPRATTAAPGTPLRCSSTAWCSSSRRRG